jgi:hypothetical protein
MNEAFRPQMAKTRHNISSIMGFLRTIDTQLSIEYDHPEIT